MPTRSLRPYFPIAPKDGQSERFLDNQFQVEFSAERDDQVEEYLTSLHQSQRDASVAALRGRTDYGKPTDQTGAVLALLTRSEAPSGPLAPADVVREDVLRWAAAIRRNGTLLAEIAAERRKAQESEAGVELLDESLRALRNGMTTTGRDQQEDFRDALNLLRQTLASPIGGRNYVTHFLTGWLLWKQGENVSEAEESFYQAFRLSAAQADLYHKYAARHRAYMQHLQGKRAEALESIERALRLFPDDTEVRYDAARYAARAGREDEAVAYLDSCLAAEPSRAHTLFSEPDFAPVADAVASLLLRRTEAARAEARPVVVGLTETVEALQSACAAVEIPTCVPEALADAAGAARDAGALLDRADLPIALGLRRTADDLRARIFAAAREALDAETARIEETLQRPRKRLERIQTDRKHWESTITALRREAKAGNFDLESPPRKSLFGRKNLLHDSAHANYLMCRENLDQIEAAMQNDVPDLEATIAAGESRQEQIRRILADFTVA